MRKGAFRWKWKVGLGQGLGVSIAPKKGGEVSGWSWSRPGVTFFFNSALLQWVGLKGNRSWEKWKLSSNLDMLEPGSSGPYQNSSCLIAGQKIEFHAVFIGSLGLFFVLFCFPLTFCTFVCVHVEVRGQLKRGLSYHPVGPGSWTQIIRLGSKNLYALCRLSSFYLGFWWVFPPHTLFSESRLHPIAQVALELIMSARLILKSGWSSCFSISSVGISGVNHHAWLTLQDFFFMFCFVLLKSHCVPLTDPEFAM